MFQCCPGDAVVVLFVTPHLAMSLLTKRNSLDQDAVCIAQVNPLQPVNRPNPVHALDQTAYQNAVCCSDRTALDETSSAEQIIQTKKASGWAAQQTGQSYPEQLEGKGL